MRIGDLIQYTDRRGHAVVLGVVMGTAPDLRASRADHARSRGWNTEETVTDDQHPRVLVPCDLVDTPTTDHLAAIMQINHNRNRESQ